MKTRNEILQDLAFWTDSAKEWSDLALSWAQGPLAKLATSEQLVGDCLARVRGSMMCAATASRQLAALAKMEPAVPVGPEDWDL